MEKSKKEDGSGREDSLRSKEENKEGKNLGLDADHSSDQSGFSHLNNDNDRISHNPDGESDDSDSDELPGQSPLMEK